jgi:hypothetical protein
VLQRSCPVWHQRACISCWLALLKALQHSSHVLCLRMQWFTTYRYFKVHCVSRSIEGANNGMAMRLYSNMDMIDTCASGGKVGVLTIVKLLCGRFDLIQGWACCNAEFPSQATTACQENPGPGYAWSALQPSWGILPKLHWLTHCFI